MGKVKGCLLRSGTFTVVVLSAVLMVKGQSGFYLSRLVFRPPTATEPRMCAKMGVGPGAFAIFAPS